VGCFNHPFAGFISRINLFLLFLLFALCDVRGVASIFDSLLCRGSSVTFVSKKILVSVWLLNYNSIEDTSQLADIMPVCSGYDYRQRDPTPVYQNMALAAFFFPYPSGCDL